MLTTETKIRIRFGETDKMSFVYYGNYALYYEQARTEMMRYLGLSYKEMEKKGTVMPVLEMHTKYLKPAFYDDLIIIKTFLRQMPTARIRFDYEIYNEKTDLLNKGYTVLTFANAKTLKPVRPPKYFLDSLAPYFDK
ncbi:MAG TPA: acyl-CoA thioesterase [Bacteroidales bacterium]|nr:acyl-CoA thioesterase [Bacteroidales bacterium]